MVDDQTQHSAAAAAAPAPSTEQLAFYKSPEGYQQIVSWYDSVLNTIDVPFTSQYVTTRFGNTHMLAAGPVDAPPLFLIPGVAGCAPLWRRQLPRFAQALRVYALDIPGQPGRSDPCPPSLLNRDYVNWLLDVLDGLGIQRAHFAGVSVGAWLAMRMGIEAPERVNKVVLLGPTGISRAKLPVRVWVTKYLSKRRDADALQDDLTAKSVSSKSPGGSFGTFDRQLARAMALCTRHYRIDKSLGVYNERTGRVDLVRGIRVLGKFFLAEPKRELRAMEVPGLAVFGEHEVLYRPHAVARRAERLMPRMSCAVVPGAGHAAIYDKPEEVNEMVLEFLLA